jgi:hypothetical protein
MKISSISLLAYDIAFFEESVRSYIDIVDELLIGFDENRQTWSGGTYELDATIQSRLSAISNKIRFIEDIFYIPGLGPMENDVRERNFLSSHIENADWILSIDADELLINPGDLHDYLRHLAEPDVCVLGSWITVYKELADGYLVIGNERDQVDLGDVPIVTDKPEVFVNARWTKQKYMMSPALLLHFSWARSEAELRKKLINWSHADDFTAQHHLELWLNANERTYKTYRNFHPVTPEAWPRLVFIPKDKLRRVASELACQKAAAR